MADETLTEHHSSQPPPPPLSNSNNTTSDLSHGDFHSLPIPPLDPLFFSTTNSSDDFISDLPITFDDNYDFDINFDDLDGVYLPSENESFLIPETALDSDSFPVTAEPVDNSSPQSGSSEVCADQGSDVDKYIKANSSDAGSCNSGDPSFDSDRGRSFHSPVSSQSSGNCGSLVSEAPSPDSGHFVVDQKIKVEEGNAKNSIPKRKKETAEEDTNREMRNQKFRRSEDAKNVSSQCDSLIGGLNEEEEKKRARLMRNRESAQLSRQRKKHYVEELEEKVRAMHSTIADLNGKISFFMAENASLKQQLSGNGMCPPPMYPAMPPVAYPWMHCSPYVVKPQGSQVPLVPIPRLKPQQPASLPKAKKAETKKVEGKTKKVASVSLFGLLLFVLLFGGMVPVVDLTFGGVRESSKNMMGFVNDRFYDKNRGNILIVNGSHVNKNLGSRSGCSDFDSGKKGGFGQNVHLRNGSEPLVASLYVPRNDKLVKIDGHLIINSVLASEKAMATRDTNEMDSRRDSGLAIPNHLSAALAIPDVGSNRGRSHPYPTSTERQKVLASGYTDSLKDQLKSSVAEGKQQWFHEGLAGPMLSSGLCSEVFQFDASPAAGAIIPASSVSNVTSSYQQNATNLSKGKNRRILRGLPIPLARSDLNISGEQVKRNSQKDNFEGNKSTSSLVVSVLVDPREASDVDVDGVMKPKSLSRIFVVVLVDSVKYVTYSCMLPRSGPHLVTT